VLAVGRTVTYLSSSLVLGTLMENWGGGRVCNKCFYHIKLKQITEIISLLCLYKISEWILRQFARLHNTKIKSGEKKRNDRGRGEDLS
jgi:hypothetical protein